MVKAKKYLGQHFLKNEEVCQAIADGMTGHNEYDKLVEIGPGTGVLTKYLLSNPIDLVAMDLDSESIIYLNHSFPLEHPKVLEGEGSFKVIEADFELRVTTIIRLLEEVSPLVIERKDQMRERLRQNFEEYVTKGAIDENRFEQELLYYLEKMDITEEQVRLSQHCKYFLEELGNKKKVKGRKLNFITQEMGREINTLGSKANHSKIQHIVVQMKDELEKIKEQLANTL